MIRSNGELCHNIVEYQQVENDQIGEPGVIWNGTTYARITNKEWKRIDYTGELEIKTQIIALTSGLFLLLFHQSFGDARDDFLFLVAEDVERVQVSLEQSVQEEEDLFIFFVLVAEFTQRDGDASLGARRAAPGLRSLAKPCRRLDGWAGACTRSLVVHYLFAS